MVSYQKGPTRRGHAWQIGPFPHDTLVIWIKFHEFQGGDEITYTLLVFGGHKSGTFVWRVYLCRSCELFNHYGDVMMGVLASQISSLTIVYSNVYSGADRRKHQSSMSLAFVQGIHRWPLNSPHKWLVTRKMLAFDDVIMLSSVNDLGITKQFQHVWYSRLTIWQPLNISFSSMSEFNPVIGGGECSNDRQKTIVNPMVKKHWFLQC